MKHKMKFLVLGCVVLIGLASFGLASFVNAEDDMLPVNPIFRDKNFDRSKAVERHVVLDPMEISCFNGADSLENEFRRSNLIFTGVVIENTNRKKITEHVMSQHNLITFRHSVISGNVFEVSEILKAPVGFKKKKIHVEPLSRKKVGEEYIIYANIKNEEGAEHIVSKECARHKLVSEQGIEYWRKKEAGDENSIFLYGLLEHLTPNPVTLKEKKANKVSFNAKFLVKEVLSNPTEISNTLLKNINVFVRDCKNDFLQIDQEYVWHIHARAMQSGNVMQFRARCSQQNLFIANELQSIRKLAKNEHKNIMENGK